MEKIKSCQSVIVTKPMHSQQIIEKSIQKTYRRSIWTPFIKAIHQYELVEDGDKIAVAISGGKDSLLLAKLFQQLKKTKQFDFEVVFIVMNPGFSEANLSQLILNCASLGIEIEMEATPIFDIVSQIAPEYPCYHCAKMRRGDLYAHAKRLGCNKLALGHHLDDVVETVLLNIFYGGKFETMLPKLKAKNVEAMHLIRPLYLVEEHDIIRYTKYNGICAMDCGCVVAAKKTSSKRAEMKDLIKNLSKVHPDVKKSILNSTKNVNLSKILGFKESNN